MNEDCYATLSRRLNRRAFIGAGAAFAAWPMAASAQGQRSRPLIAYLVDGVQAARQPFDDSLMTGLRELGWNAGANFDIVYRYDEGFVDRLPALAAELVALNPDLIIANGARGPVAARKLTATIPIVSQSLVDPVGRGLGASINRPGGNVTGIMSFVEGLAGKQLQFAVELVAGATRVGVLVNNADELLTDQLRELEAAASTLGVRLTIADARSPDDLERTFAVLARQRVDAIVVMQSVLFVNERQKVLSLAARFPTVYTRREFVEEGGLASYGINLRDGYHRLGYFIDRILKGTPAGYLPIEFPTRFDFVINLKTAKAQRVDIPERLMVFATEVIE